MGGTIGNQNACGSSYDIKAETKALDEWSKRDDATALVQFCVERDIYAQRIYEWRDEDKSFAEVLKKTKMRLAARLRDKLNDKEHPYNYGLFQREIGSHDAFLHDHEEEVKDKDATRIAKARKADSQDDEATREVVRQIGRNRKFPS